MKKLNAVTCYLLLVTCLHAAPIDAFEAQVEKIDAELIVNLGVCADGYRKSLDGIANRLQMAGDLDGLLTVRKEKARAEKDAGLPETALVEKPAELKALQQQYLKNRQNAEAANARKILQAAAACKAEMEQEIKDLTRANKIEEALKVKAGIAQFATNAIVVHARIRAGDDGQALPPGVGEQRKPLPDELKKGLVLYYTFDKNDADKVADDSGGKNKGTVSGAKWIEQGKLGGAFDFDGKSAYVDAGRDAAVDLKPAGMTVAAWVYNSQRVGKTATELRTVLCQRGDDRLRGGFALSYGYMKGFGWDNNVITFSFFGGVAADAVGVEVKQGAWTHIVGVFENGKGQLYVNGSSVTVRRYGLGSIPFGENLCIGRAASWTPFFQNHKGKIDEVMVWSRGLSEREVKLLYEGQK